ncbi:SUF system NifU family Fe-S cluster assembly protein, partial [Streptomyces sp. RKCA-744]|nr:SUF system NifU family Fe-S cluster assembly protein [Streptomyces sp. RKCA744]
MKLDSMYQDVILDHYKNPHGRGLRDGDAEVHHV